MTPSRQRILIIGLIVIGMLTVGFFGMRALHAFRKFDGHRPPKFSPAGAESAETDVGLIRDWMTIGYISHTYRMPPRLLYETLGIPPKANEEKSLKQLNEEYFPDKPDYVIEIVKATIQTNLPPPAPTPPVPVSPPVVP